MVCGPVKSALHAFCLVALAGFSVGGCGNSQSQTVAAPAGWVRDCPGNAFCFQRPANLVLKPAQAIDSLAAEYRSDEIVLRYDYGRYPTSLAHLVNPREERISVDGRAAKAIHSDGQSVLVKPLYSDFSRPMAFTLGSTVAVILPP